MCEGREAHITFALHRIAGTHRGAALEPLCAPHAQWRLSTAVDIMKSKRRSLFYLNFTNVKYLFILQYKEKQGTEKCFALFCLKFTFGEF
jgi:hypothetical protein